MDGQHDRLRKARIAAGFKSAAAAADAQRPKWNKNSYASNENGNAPFSFKTAQKYAAAFNVRAEWLYAGSPPMREQEPTSSMVRIIGIVGAASDGEVVMETAHDRWDYTPMLPGLSDKAFAVEVRGGSMPGIAEEGSLLYGDGQLTKPDKDMLNRVVILETADGRVLVKRLMRGSEKGLFDLESVVGPTIEDVKLRWVAHIRFIAPPVQAEQIIKRWDHAA